MTPRSHRIATKAYELVKARYSPDSKDETMKKYGALVHKLPAMILQCGLAQTTGFLLAKGENEHCKVLDDLKSAFQHLSASPNTELTRDQFHESILKSDLQQHMVHTRQALEIAGWLRRYVQGVLNVNATGEKQDEHRNEEVEPTL